MSRRAKLGGIVSIAVSQLRQDWVRTVLAVVGITLAVLSVTLLLGISVGVTETGNELLRDSGRDIWVTGGPIELAPATVGGFQNPIVDAHSFANSVENHDRVRTAVPLSFQVVYVSTDGEHFETIMGTGTPGAGSSSVTLENGSGFSGGAQHYAGGSYDGPMSHEIIVDPQTAERFDLEVGDTLYVGGTVSTARNHEFEVVGISPTFARFLGTGTVTMPLSELQTVTGTAYDDRATLVTISVEEGADPKAVAEDLEAAYPEYTFKTNREQFVSVLERQATAAAAGLSLSVLGVVTGVVLSLNLLLSLVYGQREVFAVMRALGSSRTTVIGIAAIQATTIAVAGCFVGLLTTPLAAAVLDQLVANITGYEGVVSVPRYAYGAGIGIAAGFAVVGAVGGAWRMMQTTDPIAMLK